MKSSEIDDLIKERKKRWLITGVAGFIGSHLLERLLITNQEVVGLDDFSTGFEKNLNDVKEKVGKDRWDNFSFQQGDVRELKTCLDITKGVDIILHQAALGSVPRSIGNPVNSNDVNVNGTLNIFWAAKENEVSRVIYASSSSVYGSDQLLPKVEGNEGDPLSPYALTKKINEDYAKVFREAYGLSTIGLRYFNVFGPRQNPDGPYAAVIPLWISKIMANQEVVINGDGKTSRDFTYIENVVNLNILAAIKGHSFEANNVFNGACQKQTSLIELFNYIKEYIIEKADIDINVKPKYLDFRLGDVRHSLADISKSTNSLNYSPVVDVRSGLRLTIDWFYKNEISTC